MNFTIGNTTFTFSASYCAERPGKRPAIVDLRCDHGPQWCMAPVVVSKVEGEWNTRTIADQVMGILTRLRETSDWSEELERQIAAHQGVLVKLVEAVIPKSYPLEGRDQHGKKIVETIQVKPKPGGSSAKK